MNVLAGEESHDFGQYLFQKGKSSRRAGAEGVHIVIDAVIIHVIKADRIAAAELRISSQGGSAMGRHFNLGHNRDMPFLGVSNRSEERRVGKECRSRWSTPPE